MPTELAWTILLYTGLEDEWMVVVNAGNRDKGQFVDDCAGRRAAQASGFDVTLEDVSDEFYMLAFQGPQAEEVLQRLESFDLSELKYHQAREFHIHDDRGILARTGYTGEDGFESVYSFFARQACVGRDSRGGQGEGVQPIGLGARDSLRFEAKFALYGHEIDANTTPIEAALGWACDLDKEFHRARRVAQTKTGRRQKKLVGFEMIERGIARNGYEIASNGRWSGM